MALMLLMPQLNAAPVYICQHNGKAIYTSYPQKLPQGRCKISAMQAENSTDTANTDEDAIRRFWYRLEFGQVDAQTPIPSPPPPPPVPTVRPPSSNTITTSAPARPVALSARQLIERDIGEEKKALQQAQQQLIRAQQSANSTRIHEWRSRVDDHLKNIRALNEELKRH